MGFWETFETAQRHAFAGHSALALDVLEQAEAEAQDAGPDLGASRHTLIAQLKTFVTGAPEPSEPLGPIQIDAEPGISLVTCAMNRTKNLLGALPSWLACPEITEIIIVDWSSDAPVADALTQAGISDPRIRVARVEGEPRWILSYAFNVGFRLARFDKILKADADIVLQPAFFERNPLPEGAFIAGNWRRAKEGQAFINGFFFAARPNLAKVAGFNEFITTYGWDDDDLYDRLQEIGARRIDVDPDTIYHQPHSDAERTGEVPGAQIDAFTEITNGTMYRIRRNRFLANVMPLWNRDRHHVPYSCAQGSDGGMKLTRDGVPPHTVPSHTEADADYYALLELASWRLGEQVWGLDRDALRILLQKPFSELGPEDITMVKKLRCPALAPTRSRLFIDAQHGLGNRMRAIGSAAAIAEATGRELVIIWQPDHHCEGQLSDLYDYEGAIVEEAFVQEAWGQGCQVYNYMEVEEGAQKDAPLDLSWGGDIYARAAYVLNAEPSSWESENRFLKALRPTATVRDLVAGVRTPNDVSAHVRMVGGTDYEHLAYEDTDNWTKEGHEQTDFWRRKSHFSHFIARLDTLIAEGDADRILLAADLPETYEAFLETFGDRVAYLKRDVYDRSAEQLRYALADAILLGTSPRLLGSSWSSFSELAMRLSPHQMELEMSGRDF